MLSSHIGTEGDTLCAGVAAQSTSPSVVRVDNSPGGDDFTYDMLIVMRGDGTAVLQERRKNISYGGDTGDAEWEAAMPQELCTVVVGEGQVGCEDPASKVACEWDPFGGAEDDPEFCCAGGLADCQPLEPPYDCESIAALFEADETTGGATTGG